MVFVEIYAKKRQIWVSGPLFGKLEVTPRPWLMAPWKAHGRHSSLLNFSLPITIPELVD